MPDYDSTVVNSGVEMDALLSKANTALQPNDAVSELTETATAKILTSAERTKLTGIATGATANATDAQLRDRATHTGTQASTTITGLATVARTGSYDDLTDKPADSAGDATSIQGVAVAPTAPTDGKILVYRSGSAAYVPEDKPAAGSNPSAADVSFTPAGDIAAANVQAALVELDTEKAASAHAHGNVTSSGAVGSTSGLPLVTGASGAIQAGSFGTTAGTVCQGNDSRLTNARAPTTHASTHASGGSDAIKLDDLATPDDNTDLNASTARHGLLRKLGGGTTDFLRADGTWAVPPGSAASDFVLATPSISSGALVLDLTGKNFGYFKVSLNQNISAGGISVTNLPASGPIEIFIQFNQATPGGTLYDVPVTAFTGITGTVTFDTSWSVYQDATPTQVLLRSVDVATTWRAEAATAVLAADVSIIPTGAVAATDVQSAIAELDTDKASTAHVHGNITAAGAVGSTSGLPLITGAAGAVQAGSFGTTSGTFCQGNDPRLIDSRTPTTHASTHVNGGSDAIKLDDLSTPDDNTDLNASTTRHGLLPKLSGNGAQYLSGSGAWTTPAGGASGTDSGLMITESATIGGAMTCTFTENTSFA